MVLLQCCFRTSRTEELVGLRERTSSKACFSRDVGRVAPTNAFEDVFFAVFLVGLRERTPSKSRFSRGVGRIARTNAFEVMFFAGRWSDCANERLRSHVFRG